MSNPKQPENKVYIAYGSNLNLPQMAHRCPTAVTLATSEIKDYELVFRGSKTGSYATIEPCEGSTVPVLLWEIQPRDEFSLDVYEGYPDFYQKQLMDVPLGYGTPIYAALDGTVLLVRYASTGYGYYVMLDHGGGFTTLYAHCSSISVHEGQSVTVGQ